VQLINNIAAYGNVGFYATLTARWNTTRRSITPSPVS